MPGTRVSLEPLRGRTAKIALQCEIQCDCIFRYVLEHLEDAFASNQLKSFVFTSRMGSNHSGISSLGSSESNRKH